jgi:drug/metabolite transporter (DMT)-like permease
MIDHRLAFFALCVFWGGTWLAVKIAVIDVSPLLVACARALVSGLAMLAIAGIGPVAQIVRKAPWRVALVGILTATINFAAVFWGAARVSTGVAAIVGNATVPIALLLFGCLLREETISRRQVAGIVLGVVGLSLLFARRTGGSADGAAIAGIIAIVGGTLAYGLGSVLARPLLRMASPMTLGALQMAIGGIALVPLVWLVERPDAAQFRVLLTPAPLLSIGWMVIAGGIGATVIYLRLIRDWGPSRTSMYAFVTPIIATLLGVVVLHERLGVQEIAGAAVLLSAVALVIPRTAATARKPAPADRTC